MRASILLATIAVLFVIPVCSGGQISDVGGLIQPMYFVGYYASWSAYWPSWCNVVPENIPADRYTHIVWSFVTNFNSSGYIFNLTGDDLSLMQRFVAMKSRNSNLKLLAAFGGGAFDPSLFSAVASPSVRATFASNAVNWLRSYGLDGIDIDWEYPVDSDAPNIAPFFKAIRDAITADATASGKSPLLLTSAAPAGNWVLPDYQPQLLQPYVDYLSLMLYDDYGASWMPTTGPLAALNGDPSADLDDHTQINDYLAHNVSISKLTLGIPNYAATFTVNSTNGLYQAQTGAGGNPGTCSPSPGSLSASELTMLQKNLTALNGATYWDQNSSTPYIMYGDQFITYENERSVSLKLDYFMQTGAKGIMMWVIDRDTHVSDQVWSRVSAYNKAITTGDAPEMWTRTRWLTVVSLLAAVLLF